jgi:hypothetical protein
MFETLMPLLISKRGVRLVFVEMPRKKLACVSLCYHKYS